jgi:hypothetical protein
MKRAIVIAAVLASSTALASPKGKEAKAAWDRGVVAYQKGDFVAASEALGQSYKLEPDVETLFAWAQSERQQNKCESAIELYKKLLDSDMPTENKAAVQTKLDECKAIIAAKTGTTTRPIEEPIKEPIKREEPPPPSEGSPWYKDPIGDALTIGGVAAVGVGVYFLAAASKAEERSKESHENFQKEQDDAESKGRIGVILSITGGALIVGGVVRYMTRSSGKERTSVSGWITPDGGGGLAAFGRF